MPNCASYKYIVFHWNITLPHFSSNHLISHYKSCPTPRRNWLSFFLVTLTFISTHQDNFSSSMSICPPRSSLKYFLPIFLPVPLHTILFLSNPSHLFSPFSFSSSSLLSFGGEIWFWGRGAVAVLASVGRAGKLPAPEHHSGNQSHAVGFISNQPVSWCSLWA